jgi:hypothetical protein
VPLIRRHAQIKVPYVDGISERKTRQQGRALTRPPSEAAYFSCVEIEEKVVLSFVPTPLTAVMMATAIPGAIWPYSMAVAPDSSARKLRNFVSMGALPDL